MYKRIVSSHFQGQRESSKRVYSLKVGLVVSAFLDFRSSLRTIQAATRDRTGLGSLVTARVARPLAHCFMVFITTTNRIR